ncbi:MAG: hypothetical protein B7Z08_01395 [Sphingomonadales bacterium 32-68-7]|nr:MAG: hypothetical protein B7Z33_08730 [Sphingomonadales bacterium 12-68-11]OYX10372.1 MAG: hypothetical protein B7Z08_01395 [Sphingomonadales bacterium 32-68-7]
MRDAIGAWLSADDGDAYVEYCRGLGLDESALATLLLVREVNAGRLHELKALGGLPNFKQKRVTIRPKGSGLREKFLAHAKANGLGLEQAAALVLMAETREKWLEQVLLGDAEPDTAPDS